MTRIRELLARLVNASLAGDPIEIVIRATLLAFLLGPNLVGFDWHYKLIFKIASVIGLLAPAVSRTPVFWCLFAALMFGKTCDHWWIQDNHIFLLTWWMLTLALGLFTRGRSQAIQLNARILIGLSFFFAVWWKAFLSADYMSGEYFHYTFLTDERFAPLGKLLCRMSEADYARNYAAFRRLTNYAAEVQTVQLVGTETLRVLAVVVTWWTVLIEGVLALLFLLPRSNFLSRWRDPALLFFAWTTYLAAPVMTFGWTLITLGLAQCDPAARRIRVGYLLTYPLLLIYEHAPIWRTIHHLAERIFL